ncbi:hypothetical protein D3C80_1121430 [compost metagenome]
MLAAVDDAAHSDQITRCKPGNLRPYGCDTADDLVTGHTRKLCTFPFGAHLVQIRVADTAIGDLDLYIFRPELAASDAQGFKGFVARMGAISEDLH